MIGAILGLAAGLSAGHRQNQEDTRRNRIEDEDRAFQKESRDRTRSQWADDDSLKNDIKEGDRVFSETIKSFDRPQLAQVPIAQESGQAPQMSQDPTMVDQPDAMGRPIPQMSRAPQTLSLAQTSAAQPAPAAPGIGQAGAVPTMGKGGKPGMLNQEAPDPRVLAAMQAKTNHFLNKGRVDQYKKSWLETSEMRAQIRASEFAGADKEYALSGDPTVYAKRVYPLIEDGHDFVDSKVVPGQDGKPAVSITRRDQATGEVTTGEVPVDKFMRSVEIARDPAAVLGREAAYAKKLFETNEEIRKEQAKSKIKGDEDRTTETLKSKQKLESIRLEKGMEGGNAIALENTKQLAPRTLTPGQEVTVPQRQKDGSIKYVTAAKNDASKAVTGTTDSQLSAMAITNFGDNDPVSGRKIGNDRTARIAAAARVIQKANPGLDANQAIEAAAREVAKPVGAK